MLAPLLVIPRAGSEAPLLLGRGHLLGLVSDDWEKLYSESAARARTELTPSLQLRLTPGDAVPLLGAFEQLLLIAIHPAPAANAWWHRLLEALESRAQMGGGAILFAPALPQHELITRYLTPGKPDGPEKYSLQDDAGQPVRHMRSGEWCALRFELPAQGLPPQGMLQLRLEGAQTGFLSPPSDVSAWHLPMLAPHSALASFAAPGAPGNYRARLLLNSRAVGEEIQFRIKPAAFATPPERFNVEWHFHSAVRLAPLEAARMHEPSAPSRLLLGADGAHWLSGDWYAPEPGADGTWRRWISGCAEWRASGRGRAWIRIEDHRPRVSSEPPLTRANLLLDGRPCQEFLIDRPGAHRLEFPWPDDDLNHTVCMQVSPLWTPKAFNAGTDNRSLGLLITGSEIGHG